MNPAIERLRAFADSMERKSKINAVLDPADLRALLKLVEVTGEAGALVEEAERYYVSHTDHGKTIHALCAHLRAERARVAAVEAAAERVTRMWADLASQEMYGESIAAAMNEEDRQSFEDEVQELRAALAGKVTT